MPPVIKNDEGADVLVLAGDICTTKSIVTLDKFFQACADNFDLVLYVPGNHELYRWEYPNDKEHLDFIRKYLEKFPNINLVDNELVNYKGLRIACATLWTDFEEGALVAEAHRILNDYRWGLRAAVVYGWFEESYEFLKNSQADVVITHHAPLEQSVHARFVGDPANGLFHSRLDDLVNELRPHLWVHGHMHNNCDYVFGGTRVVCNPLGYGRENPQFEYVKVVDVPTLR